MCGIAGIVNLDGLEVSADILAGMRDAMSHRGPDDSGLERFGNVGIAHRRLSIIDLHGGRQPMSDEQGNVWTVLNGEIYNFKELRKGLQDKGHVFKTSSDTETIVHLYEEKGADFVGELWGMFALAVYDRRAGKLLLARDRIGKKPLFYFKTDKRMAFASELQGLKRHPDMPRELDFQAMFDYFTFQHIPAPATAYKGVCKLPAGHMLELDARTGRHEIRRYWRPDYGRKAAWSYPDARAELRKLTRDAVERRMVSDVPLGVFLSGGIDSTIVAGTMAEMGANPLKIFTIGFEDRKYDERLYANEAAAFIKGRNLFVEHFEKVVDEGDFDVVERLARHFGEPYCDASMLPTFMLCKFAREHVTVALGGDGADELFAGYNRYLVMKLANLVNPAPAGLRKLVARTIKGILFPMTQERSVTGMAHRLLDIFGTKGWSERYLKMTSRFDDDRKRKVLGERFGDAGTLDSMRLLREFEASATAKGDVEMSMEFDLRDYLPGDILAKVDTASMANSLEVRSPFLDHRVAEFAASLPLDFKLNRADRKHILKDAFSDMLPPDLYNRNKMGFGVPLATWFRSKWREMLRTRLLDGVAARDGYLDRAALEEMLDTHQNMKGDMSYPLWVLLIFEIFLDQQKNG